MRRTEIGYTDQTEDLEGLLQFITAMHLEWAIVRVSLQHLTSLICMQGRELFEDPGRPLDTLSCIGALHYVRSWLELPGLLSDIQA